MSLFNTSDLYTGTLPVEEIKQASAVRFPSATAFANDKEFNRIADAVGHLSQFTTCCFVTHGAWSNISLLEFVLAHTGAAALHFTTWSISADAIVRLATWHQEGLLTDLHAVLDTGLNNRKPDLYQLAIGSFPKIRTTKIHGKIAVITNERYHITITGSANLTENKRIETGVIISNREVAEFNINWIMKEFEDVH